MRRTSQWLSAVFAVALLLSAVPLLAEERERPWQVKGFGVFIDGGFSTHYNDYRAYHEDDDIRLSGDYGAGLYASLEYRPIPNLGIELGHLLGAVGSNAAEWGGGTCCSYTDSMNLGFSSLLLGLNVHLTPDTRIDVSVGPIIGHMWYSNLNWNHHGHDSWSVTVSNAFAWGGGIGLDIPIGESNWSIAVTAKYLDTEIESSSRHGTRIKTSFDPFIAGVGFGFKF